MKLSIPDIRVDPPMCCEGLAIFPLYAERGYSPKAIPSTASSSSPRRRRTSTGSSPCWTKAAATATRFRRLASAITASRSTAARAGGCRSRRSAGRRDRLLVPDAVGDVRLRQEPVTSCSCVLTASRSPASVPCEVFDEGEVPARSSHRPLPARSAPWRRRGRARHSSLTSTCRGTGEKSVTRTSG